MAEIVRQPSSKRFTSPVRKFKENDPYYYEVENIPLTELENNDLWLKDQLDSLTVSNIGRADIAELKPYAPGNSNIVNVKPGRYTARINDAYDITPLQSVVQALGQAIGDYDHWTVHAKNSSTIETIIERLQSEVAADALNMNGLAERAFHYPTVNPDTPANSTINSTSPSVTNLQGFNKSPFPISEVQLWAKANQASQLTYVVKSYLLTQPGYGSVTAGSAESHLVKYWRGVTRTAIVDVPNELSITIPDFDEDDFFYRDANSNKVKVGTPQTRIDLLFIYSKPIDTSAVHVAKYVNGSPTKLTDPVLGIVKGAGIGYSEKGLANLATEFNPETGIDSEGNLLMLPHAADQNNTNNGFKGLSVHGSFPSPDDLLNLAPVISEKIESNNYLLLGQSILPIAYIVVNRTATRNTAGTAVITDSDIIDIRPFFRTAELAYNERAGIAAALPALSLANPAVGKANLDYELERTYKTLDGRITAALNTGKQITRPVPVGGGYVFGGANFGPEGALIDYYKSVLGASTPQNRLKQELVARTSLPSTTLIPDLPDWDISEGILVDPSYLDKGEYPNDRINTMIMMSEQADFAAYSDRGLTTKLFGFGTDLIFNNAQNVANIHYVKKKILIDKAAVPWMQDYFVNAHFVNCTPLSNRAYGHDPLGAAGAAGIWIEKKQDSFIIYCAWTATDHFENTGSEGKVTPGAAALPVLNREGSYFAGFAVINSEVQLGARTNNGNYTGEPNMGVSIYPSIYFEIVGVPSNFAAYRTDLNATDPTISLF